MFQRISKIKTLLLVALFAVAAGPSSFADDTKPVKVYILSGQSNMVGIGQAVPLGVRWGGVFAEPPVVSVYPGKYDPEVDYDKLEPIKTVKLERFANKKDRTPYPGGGVQIVRGLIKVPETGFYEFRPGYGGSTYNIMVIDGKEIYRKTPDGQTKLTPIKLSADEKVPFKITYLTKSADSLGWVARADTPGVLQTEVKLRGKYSHLMDDKGDWAVRDDVWYKGLVTATANKWLSIGCGKDGSSIGPELGFGWQLGDYHDEPVLILKTSQGNRSLAWDFLPPGSERFEAMAMTKEGEMKMHVFPGYKDTQGKWLKGTEPADSKWYAGKQYDECFGPAKDVLANFDKHFPHWKGRGYEIAGFAWWQGHKDKGSAMNVARYEKNLVHLINTLRKEFDAPKAPFVVGTVGFGGFDEMGERFVQIAEAQLAVGDAEKHPQFKGNVKSVETRGFWKSAEESPKNQSFHYHQNGEVYYLVGDALGKGMIELLEGK